MITIQDRIIEKLYELTEQLTNIGIDLKSRAENVTIEQYIQLSNCIK